MWNWLVRFWHTLTNWKHREPAPRYYRSNLHGRHR